MTREEAMEEILAYMESDCYLDAPSNEACEIALKALRPVSRERVEKVFPGCPYCKPDSEGYVQKFGAYSILNGELKTGHCKPQKISFCPHCSRPLTDEAVEMVMEKINNMEEITNEH